MEKHARNAIDYKLNAIDESVSLDNAKKSILKHYKKSFDSTKKTLSGAINGCARKY